MSKHGLFVAIEGGEGSGKDTQIELLKKSLDPQETVFTREPGGTEVGEKIRAFLLSPKTKIDPEVELLGFLTARAVLMETVIRPALREGKTVISNRFGLSTIAYQIHGRERWDLLPWLQQFSAKIVGDDCPHYILLDIDPLVGLGRVETRGESKTRFDAENIEFHMRVRLGYLNHYREGAESYHIPAENSVEDIHRYILRLISRFR